MVLYIYIYIYIYTHTTGVECATPILAHATFSPKSQYQYGDVVVFTCDEGYIYDKNITYEMQCLASGEWNINTPGCQRKAYC